MLFKIDIDIDFKRKCLNLIPPSSLDPIPGVGIGGGWYFKWGKSTKTRPLSMSVKETHFKI